MASGSKLLSSTGRTRLLPQADRYKPGIRGHFARFVAAATQRPNELGRTNVWHYAGVNTFRAGRLDELQSHPTVKPVALVADAMKDWTRRGDTVLDIFCGSGTTILAAERVGRRHYGSTFIVPAAIPRTRRQQAYRPRSHDQNGFAFAKAR
jgi:hypothetical protein